MAETRDDKSSEDLSEEATPYRIEEFRRKGMVAQSKELATMVSFLAMGSTIYFSFPKIINTYINFMREVFRADLSAKVDLGTMQLAKNYLMKSLEVIITIGLPICGAGFIFGVVGSILQVGTVFSVDPILPDLEKINPIQGVLRFFSIKQAIEGFRTIVKTAIILFVSYLLVKSEVLISNRHFGSEPISLLHSYGEIGRTIFFALVSVLGVFAGFDFFYQRFEFGKQLRMTKQEAKQETKEREGDPQLRSRLRAIQREISRRRIMQAVKKSDVIVTNPTHIAVALVYDKNKMSAPKVVAKGADYLAQRIKQVASEAGVPLVENVPLARTLYQTVKVGHVIPKSLYQAVAEVLAYVYRLKKRGL